MSKTIVLVVKHAAEAICGARKTPTLINDAAGIYCTGVPVALEWLRLEIGIARPNAATYANPPLRAVLAISAEGLGSVFAVTASGSETPTPILVLDPSDRAC